MQFFLRFIILFLAWSIFEATYGQSRNFDTKSFSLDKSIKQNKSIFKFWQGSIDSTRRKLIIERVSKSKDTILYDDYVRDGKYNVADRNNDGYNDLIKNYHDYDLIYFFDKKINRFKDTPVYMPITFGLVNGKNKVYWGYRDAQYADFYDYSILYKYKDSKPYFYYLIQYITKDKYGERKAVTRIELYKFENGNYDKRTFVKRIKTDNAAGFDYKTYWRTNYKVLMGYR